MTTLEIREFEEGEFLIGIQPILSVIETFAVDLDWYLVEFTPSVLVGDFDSAEPPPQWIKELRYDHDYGKSTNLPKMSWQELQHLSKYVVQFVGVLLIATKTGHASPVEPIDLNSEDWEMVVQAVDSSFWVITSQNQKLLEAVRAKFSDVHTTDATRRYF
jgi:hypothetical protein